jgi:hypothetical protein
MDYFFEVLRLQSQYLSFVPRQKDFFGVNFYSVLLIRARLDWVTMGVL